MSNISDVLNPWKIFASKLGRSLSILSETNRKMARPSVSGGGEDLSKAAASGSSNLDSARRDRILSSKLYFDADNSKVPLIYSPSYDIAFMGIEKLHPFDSSKWGRICKFLISEGLLDKKLIIEPLEAKKEDLLVVHSESYLHSLRSSYNVASIVEVPPVALLPSCLVDKNVLYPFRKQVGGTILAAKIAKERGWAINVGGGFHHCSADKGGGFCVYADISLCINFAIVRLNISRVLIIDLDAHQGNGHEKDFADDRRVYILDMYNPDIYPFDYSTRRYISHKVEVAVRVKLFSVQDEIILLLWQLIHAFTFFFPLLRILKSGTATEEYLSKLDHALKVVGDAFIPELIIYNAGTDILDGDPLGKLQISPDGISARDEKVFMFARERSIPLVMLTSGGYMKSSAKVIADSIINLSKKSLINM